MSSSETITFRRKPAGMKLALYDLDTGPGQDPPRLDIKELQRRAFERGVALERQQSSTLLHGIAQQLETAAREIEQRRAQDRAAVEEFSVKLGMMVAQRLVGTTIEEGRHDPAAMVREIIDAAVPDAVDGPVRVLVHPDDHVRLLSIDEGTEEPLPAAVELVPEPAMERGSFRVEYGDNEYWSHMNERIAALSARLLQEAEDASC